MPQLDHDGEVAVLTMGDDENRLNPTSVAQLELLLDEVEASDGPAALVTTATGKHWSTGLDLAWIEEHRDRLDDLLVAVHHLYARLLTFPVPTIAAVQGHAFAGGAMLALCHDLTVMRGDRGYWCLPEVDLGMPFTPGMNALIAARLPHRAAHEAMTTGRRYGGHEALEAGLVDATAHDQLTVLAWAVRRAGELAGKPRENLAGIKARLHRPVVDLLRDDAANSFAGGGLG